MELLADVKNFVDALIDAKFKRDVITKVQLDDITATLTPLGNNVSRYVKYHQIFDARKFSELKESKILGDTIRSIISSTGDRSFTLLLNEDDLGVKANISAVIRDLSDNDIAKLLETHTILLRSGDKSVYDVTTGVDIKYYSFGSLILRETDGYYIIRSTEDIYDTRSDTDFAKDVYDNIFADMLDYKQYSKPKAEIYAAKQDAIGKVIPVTDVSKLVGSYMNG